MCIRACASKYVRNQIFTKNGPGGLSFEEQPPAMSSKKMDVVVCYTPLRDDNGRDQETLAA